MFPAVDNSASSQAYPTRRRRKRSAGGCALGCLTTLVLLLIVLGAGWVFVGRPYVHNIAETQINKALDAAVNQVPSSPLIKLIPAGTTIPINEDTVNNLLVLNLNPSSPVQQPQTHITTQNITLLFQFETTILSQRYGFPISISLVPTAENGKLVAKNVQINGILGLVMSPDEMTDILNKHFADAQNKLGKTITGAQLKNQVFEITLG